MRPLEIKGALRVFLNFKSVIIRPMAENCSAFSAYTSRVVILVFWGRHGFDVDYKALGACRGAVTS